VLDGIQPRAERRERPLVVEGHIDEEERVGERLPGLLVDRPARELGHAVFGERAVRIVRLVFAADADDGDLRGKEMVDVQVIERRQQLAVRQVAAAAEDDDRHARCQLHAFLTAWPPN